MKKTQAEWREIEKKSTNKTINASKSQRVNEHLYNSQVCCRTVGTDPTSRKAAVCWTNEFPLNGEKRNKRYFTILLIQCPSLTSQRLLLFRRY
jgi:hypothetical protein